jgi:LIVCS family branched-chain amino acid:cation transporter
LLAAIFFGALVLNILKWTVRYVAPAYIPNFALTCIGAGIVGSALMAATYFALMYLSSLHAVELMHVPDELLFTSLATYILGSSGWLLIVIMVMLVCVSTTAALVSVVAHYVSVDVFRTRVGYIPVILLVSAISFFAGYCGICYIERITYGSVALVLYPVIIVLTLCNLLYKLAGVRSVKLPVSITFVFSLGVCMYFMFFR